MIQDTLTEMRRSYPESSMQEMLDKVNAPPKKRITTVINLFGPPGCGKSTTAASLFALMKRGGYNVELVTEYAKDLVWGERGAMLTQQDYIFAKQNNRLQRLLGKVDFIITDSPLLLGLFYLPPDFPATFTPFVLDMFNRYNNANIYLKRGFEYCNVGRYQDEPQADLLADRIQSFLREHYKYEHIELTNDDNTINHILEYLGLEKQS